jgi:hypothetical protein
MEAKMRKLVMALEALAILTAAILILVDYRLKNELVDLYKKLEATIKHGKQVFGENAGPDPGANSLRDSSHVDRNPLVEASAIPSTGESPDAARTSKRQSANRNGRNRDKAVPGPDNQVGP